MIDLLFLFTKKLNFCLEMMTILPVNCIRNVASVVPRGYQLMKVLSFSL